MLKLTRMIALNEAPGMQLLCASKLVLINTKAGLDHVTVGELFYKVAMKAIIASHEYIRKDIISFRIGHAASPVPFGIIKHLESIVLGENKMDYSFITHIKFKNGINTISRSDIAKLLSQHDPSLIKAAMWAYGKPTLLITGEGNHIVSSEGLRQDDPAADLLFTLGLREFIKVLENHIGHDETVIVCKDKIYISGDRGDIIEKVKLALRDSNSTLTLDESKCWSKTVVQCLESGISAFDTFIGPHWAAEEFLEEQCRKLNAMLCRILQLSPTEGLKIIK